MERFCDKCGSLINGDVKFCPVCGEHMQSAVDLGKPEQLAKPAQLVQSAQLVQPNYNDQPNSGYGAPQYARNITPNGVPTETMTMGQWLVTIIVSTCFGVVSLILNIVWGVSSATPEPKRSFCRAMIVINIIAMVLSNLAVLIMFGIFGDEVINFLENFNF